MPELLFDRPLPATGGASRQVHPTSYKQNVLNVHANAYQSENVAKQSMLELVVDEDKRPSFAP